MVQLSINHKTISFDAIDVSYLKHGSSIDGSGIWIKSPTSIDIKHCLVKKGKRIRDYLEFKNDKVSLDDFRLFQTVWLVCRFKTSDFSSSFTSLRKTRKSKYRNSKTSNSRNWSPPNSRKHESPEELKKGGQSFQDTSPLHIPGILADHWILSV